MADATSSRTSASSRRPRVLAIDPSPAVTEWLTMVLSAGGYDVRTALIAGRGEALFADWHPDVVLTDLALPDRDGIEVLRRLKAIDPSVDVIVMGEPGSTQRAVEAGRAGALDLLEKPLVQEQVLDLIRRAVGGSETRRDARETTRSTPASPEGNVMIGRSARMLELFALIGQVAGSDANILILGENGTGKELVANAIHRRSPRAGRPFVKINCAAIPKDLIESELCGYRKGAFTGATSDKVGLLEGADGGSLLLDEVGEMPAHLQTKLLRILRVWIAYGAG